MNISTIERTILEKCAKDAGWEIDSNSKSDCINLFSSFFKETSAIRKTSGSSFVIRFSKAFSKSHFDSGIHFNSTQGDHAVLGEGHVPGNLILEFILVVAVAGAQFQTGVAH